MINSSVYLRNCYRKGATALRINTESCGICGGVWALCFEVWAKGGALKPRNNYGSPKKLLDENKLCYILKNSRFCCYGEGSCFKCVLRTAQHYELETSGGFVAQE